MLEGAAGKRAQSHISVTSDSLKTEPTAVVGNLVQKL